VDDLENIDFYSVLQVSENAEISTIQRVFRILAQRYHPDNQETGDAERFRLVREAYAVLGDEQRRAEYDAMPKYQRHRGRTTPQADPEAPSQGVTTGDFEFERAARLAVLEALYEQRRLHPDSGAVYDQELIDKLGVSREQLEFTVWFLKEKNLVRRSIENARLSITAEGAEYLEHNLPSNLRRRLYPLRHES